MTTATATAIASRIPLNMKSGGRLESPVGTKMAEGGRVAAVFGPVKLAMNDSVFPEGI